MGSKPFTILQRVPDAVIQYKVRNGSSLILKTKGNILYCIKESKERPDLTIEMDEKVYRKIKYGEASMADKFFSGNIQIRGHYMDEFYYIFASIKEVLEELGIKIK